MKKIQFILIFFLLGCEPNKIVDPTNIEKPLGKLLIQYEREARAIKINFASTKNYHVKFFEIYYNEIKQLDNRYKAEFILISILYLNFDNYLLEKLKKIILQDCNKEFRTLSKKYLSNSNTKKVKFLKLFLDKLKNKKSEYSITPLLKKELKILSFKKCQNSEYKIITAYEKQKICITHTKIFMENIFGYLPNMSYYNRLKINCENSLLKKGCLSSVDIMIKGAYSREEKNGCPYTFYPNKLSDKGSLTWCEPIETTKGLIEKKWHTSFSNIPVLEESVPLASLITSWSKVLKIKIGMNKKNLESLMGEVLNESNYLKNTIMTVMTISPSGIHYEVAIKLSKDLIIKDLSFRKSY